MLKKYYAYEYVENLDDILNKEYNNKVNFW